MSSASFHSLGQDSGRDSATETDDRSVVLSIPFNCFNLSTQLKQQYSPPAYWPYEMQFLTFKPYAEGNPSAAFDPEPVVNVSEQTTPIRNGYSAFTLPDIYERSIF